jgi:hypothetical protein
MKQTDFHKLQVDRTQAVLGFARAAMILGWDVGVVEVEDNQCHVVIDLPGQGQVRWVIPYDARLRDYPKMRGLKKDQSIEIQEDRMDAFIFGV